MNFVYIKLHDMKREGSPGVHPGKEEDRWFYGNTYQMTKQTLNSNLIAFERPGSIPKIQSPRSLPEDEEHKIRWSLKLWLLSEMEKCESATTKSWRYDYGYELIEELLQDSVKGSGFAVLAGQKCDDLIGELLERDLFAKKCVEKFKERQNVREVCKHAMTEDMVSTLSTVSQNFFIIPRNGIDEDDVKMYGEFVYLDLPVRQLGHIDFT